MKHLALSARMATIALSVLASTSMAQNETPRVAKIVTVTAGVSDNTRQFFGNVVAKETVDLAFQVGGQLIDLPITEGATIDEGAVIASLDLEPFELALDQAKVQNEQAVRTFERLSQLQGGSVSQVTVDDAETQVKISQIAVRDAERSLRNAKLTSPFEALVASRNVANFSTINAGTPIVRLHDMSELRIEIDVPEVLFQQAGRDANVTLFAQFPSSKEMFPLALREYNAETSAVGQTYQITLGMAPPENLVVLPGSSVTVFATLQMAEQSLIVPNSAIINASDGSAQLMFFTPTTDNDGTVKVMPVVIEPTENGEVVVVSGLESGQEIVASGAHQLSDGELVRRFTGFAN